MRTISQLNIRQKGLFTYFALTLCVVSSLEAADQNLCMLYKAPPEACEEFTQYFNANKHCAGLSGGQWKGCLKEHGYVLKEYENFLDTPKTDPIYIEELAKLRNGGLKNINSQTNNSTADSSGMKLGALWATLLSAAIGLGLAYAVSNLTAKSTVGNGPKATGSKLARWVVFVACIKTSTELFVPLFAGVSQKRPMLDILSINLLGFAILATVAYFVGFVYAKINGRSDGPKEEQVPDGYIPLGAMLKTAEEPTQPIPSEDELFATVAKELMHNNRDEGLWTKAFALENGDERKTKAHYIRLRVEALAQIHTVKHAPVN